MSKQPLYSVSIYICNYLIGDERAGCFALNISLMSCDSKCSVALSRCAISWSTVYGCGIS